MNELLILLQAGIPKQDDFEKYAGPVGLMLSIVTGGFVVAIWIIYKILKEQVKEKVKEIGDLKSEHQKEIDELKLEIRNCRLEAKEFHRDYDAFKDSVIDKLDGIIQKNTTMLENNSITINENSSVLNQALGFMKTNSDQVVAIFQKFMDKFG